MEHIKNKGRIGDTNHWPRAPAVHHKYLSLDPSTHVKARRGHIPCLLPQHCVLGVGGIKGLWGFDGH